MIQISDQRPDDLQLEQVKKEIPPLGVSTSHGINKAGIAFLAAVAIIGLSAAYWALTSKSRNTPPPLKEERVEEVFVPERPTPPPPIPLARTDTAAAPPLPAASDPLSLAQRRAAGGSVFTAEDLTPTKGNSNTLTLGKPSPPKDDNYNLVVRRARDSGSVADYLGGVFVPQSENGKSLRGVVQTSNLSANAQPQGGELSALGRRASDAKTSEQQTPGSSDAGAASKADRATAFPVKVARVIPSSPDFYLPQGSALRCVMATRLISDIPGPVICNVTDDIFSMSAKRILIPKGTRVLGEYGRSRSDSLDRVAIIWNRLVTPDNIDISLASPGTDSLGSIGVPGEVNERWGERITSALMISLAADLFKVASVKYGPTISKTEVNSFTGGVTVVEEPFESETAKTLGSIPGRLLSDRLNIPATITINQGSLVNILTAEDLDFSSVYERR
jgi:type IV secretion system protein VirB10